MHPELGKKNASNGPIVREKGLTLQVMDPLTVTPLNSESYSKVSLMICCRFIWCCAKATLF